ncbi:hypothetical protein SAMN05444287_1979 [Octadecabacter temperatus]|uniref:Uncharacterized protein n=1 Tax=Octadecabacter temperatus TaxID=1458307 RepID=A0A0K0Y7G7_9RHOB|nr:hypothetical protein [Octadecabacter temperatus]AKS46855.1 hypothetical protein OSB_23190 [Octadecabacter temperatus]SIO22556.1 hypothetical protein SAMN05444287_1979 [Octadecabacter temperatus]
MTRILTLTLALLIAVTSQQMAMARGMARDASGQVILCTGQGVMTVTLDAQGEPMGPVHICPDCALTLMAFADAPIAAESAAIHIQTLAHTPVTALQIPVVPTRTQARGPPLTV